MSWRTQFRRHSLGLLPIVGGKSPTICQQNGHLSLSVQPAEQRLGEPYCPSMSCHRRYIALETMGMGCEHRPEDFLLTLVQLQNPTLNRGGWEQGNPYQRTGQVVLIEAEKRKATPGPRAAQGPVTEDGGSRTGAKRPHRGRQQKAMKAGLGPRGRTGAEQPHRGRQTE